MRFKMFTRKKQVHQLFKKLCKSIVVLIIQSVLDANKTCTFFNIFKAYSIKKLFSYWTAGA